MTIILKKYLKYLKLHITSVIFADMSIEELRPKYIRGYGKLSESAEEELNVTATELQGLLKQIKTSLPE